MFAPPFRRASPSPELPSVPQWILRYAVLIAVLFAVAISTKDLCPNNQADFPKVVHTIGPIDGHLWTITTDNWTVYELTPCKADNDSLVHCMEVGVPVSVHTKWPKLVEDVQEARNSTDLNFSVNNSLVMDSTNFSQTLVMYGDSFTKTGYFSYVFDTNETIVTQAESMITKWYPDLWFSSDIKDKGYRLIKSGKKIQVIELDSHKKGILISEGGNITKICNTGSTEEPVVKFTNDTDKCNLAMNWTLSKAVHYQHQFYFFSSDRVYIFSDKAETEASKVQVMSYADFLHCKAPTTMAPQSTHSNKTETPKNETTKVEPVNPVTKAAKEKIFNLSDHLVLIIFSVVGVVLIVFFLVYCCWWKKRDTTQNEKVESKLRSAEPNKVVKDPVSAIKSKVQSKVPKESSKVGGSKIASKTKAKCLSKVKGAKATSNAMKSSVKVGSIASLVLPKNAIKRLSKSAPKVY